MISFVNGMYTAVINGKTVKRTNLKHLEYVLRKNLQIESVAAPVVQESKFTINQRFGFLSDMIVMLAKGDQPSVVVTGPGGLGKSHTVTTALRNAGLKDLSVLDEYEVGAPVPKNAFIVIKGYSTPKGLYRTLFENRHSVIVFDDCDSVLKDAVSLNLLKGALDSYSKRIISWRADIKDEDLPTSFEFKGRVVFISNMSSNQLDQAIISRSMSVDVTMTKGGDGFQGDSNVGAPKGRIPWNKGKTGLQKHSEETKIKMSKSHKGKPAHNKGIPMSDIAKEKASKAMSATRKEKFWSTKKITHI